jgi:hypothetical protein
LGCSCLALAVQRVLLFTIVQRGQGSVAIKVKTAALDYPATIYPVYAPNQLGPFTNTRLRRHKKEFNTNMPLVRPSPNTKLQNTTPAFQLHPLT